MTNSERGKMVIEGLTRGLEANRDECKPRNTVHIVKCHEMYFEEVWAGRKCFEVRLNDRGYICGDEILLVEINPRRGIGFRQINAIVGHVFSLDGMNLLHDGVVAFCLENIKRFELEEVT